MTNTYRGMPFEVETDPYLGGVRLRMDGFCFAVSHEAWYRAQSEPAMMTRLLEDFYRRKQEWERGRIQSAYNSVMSPFDSAKSPQEIVSQHLPPRPTPNSKKGPSKLLLLC